MRSVSSFQLLLEAGGENVAIGNHFAIMMNAQQLTSSSIHLGNGLYTLCTLVRTVVGMHIGARAFFKSHYKCSIESLFKDLCQASWPALTF